MNSRTATARKTKLDANFARATRLVNSTPFEFELHAEYAKHLCVLTVGFVEAGLKDILRDYCKSQAAPQTIINYATYYIARIQNVKAPRLLETIGIFDIRVRDKLAAYIEGERKDALDSIVNQRHLIAHGNDSNITLGRVSRYYSKVVEIIAFVDAEFA